MMTDILDDHRTLLHALQSTSTTPHTVHSFLRLALQCGLVAEVVPDQPQRDEGGVTSTEGTGGEIATFATARTFSGILALNAVHHFSLFSEGSSGDNAGDEARCAFAEPVAAAILLFSHLFRPVAHRLQSADVQTSSLGMEGSRSGNSNSFETSFEVSHQPPPSNKVSSLVNLSLASHQLAELRRQRDELCVGLLSWIDEQIRTGLSRLVVAEHVKKVEKRPTAWAPSSSSEATSRGPSSPTPSADRGGNTCSAFVGKSKLVLVQQRLGKLHWWKSLIVSCLVIDSLHPNDCSPRTSSTAVDALDLLLSESQTADWQQKPLREWGWATLGLAERHYDEVVAKLQATGDCNGILARIAPPCNQLPVALSSLYVQRLGPSVETKIGFTGALLSLIPATQTSINHLRYSAGCLSVDSAPFLFNASESSISAVLNAATQKKLNPQQISSLVDEIQRTCNNNEAGSNHSSNNNNPFQLRPAMKKRLLQQFLTSKDKMELLAEKNKELFTSIFLLLHAILKNNLKKEQEEENTDDYESLLICRETLVGVLHSLQIGEPSCHIIKALYDESAITDDELSTFVSNAVRQIDELSRQAADGQQRATRGAMMLSLLTQNICLARKKVVLTSAVEAEVLTFCIQFGKVKACTELYAAINALKKR